ncbi:MAG: tripartite tricarboxylate transporter substrate binding protein [Hyphomicrobiales bacterium]|nr:tripartite tricarboxylate transporter substrate binding protein [Hyphomicrobiales bacterium]
MLTLHHVGRLALLAAAASLLSLAPVRAQDPAADYPNRPIRIIVSNPAGGGIDTVTRIVADKLSQKIGQPVVIENRGGAGGNIGTEAVYTSSPDGYTLLASVPAALTTNIFLYKKLNFDPAKLEPVAVLGTFPNTLLVKNDFPAKTVQEFVAFVKANPGKVNYASQGIGTTSHLTAELYNSLTGARMVHVPYRGTAPALNDIVAGHVDLIFMQLSSALKLHEGKRARILAVTTAKRLPALKDIPTMIEAGVPNFISDTWNAISAPPGTPAAILAKLNKAINESMDDPEVEKRFLELEIIKVGGSPADMRRLIQEETARWGEVIKRAGIKPE